MAADAEFQSDVWYPARVQSGAHLGESTRKGTLFLSVKFEIASGDMYGSSIEGQFYLTDKTKEQTAENLAVVDFDVYSAENWAKVSELIAGKECELSVQVQDYKGNRQVKVNRLRHKREGAELPLYSRAAMVYGAQPVAAGTTEDSSDPPF